MYRGDCPSTVQELIDYLALAIEDGRITRETGVYVQDTLQKEAYDPRCVLRRMDPHDPDTLSLILEP